MSFFEIVASQDLEKITQALAEGAQVNELEPGTRMTPLMIACGQKGGAPLEIISALINAGADVNHVRASDKMTALKLAAQHCSGAVVKMLLDSGADLEGPPGAKTALFLASEVNNFHAVMALIAHGADLTMGGVNGGEAVGLAEDDYAQRSSKTCDTPQRDFASLLDELNTWLATHRPQFLSKLNSPVPKERLEHVEQSTGMKLPKEYKLLLSWKDGQPDDCFEDFHPFLGEMFMSLASTEAAMEMMHQLIESGDIDDRHWHRDWLPFLADGGGNHTCIDLSPVGYGKIVGFDHEVGFAGVLHDNMAAWLQELLEKLQYLDVEAWEREQSS